MHKHFFYHSFPRPRRGEDQSSHFAKALEILECIKDIGLVCAPEIVPWTEPRNDGSLHTIKMRQTRLSFTDLTRKELPEHEKMFGPISLEFETDVLRNIGALPVIYMPLGSSVVGHMNNLGTLIVSRTSNIKYTIEQLQSLKQITDPEYRLYSNLTESITHLAPDCMINLQNVDDQGRPAKNTEISVESLRGVIDYIGFRNAPFDLMMSVLSLVQTLFYPTDSTHNSEQLTYYRQREWRLTGGLIFNQVVCGRILTEPEKERLLDLDERFWGSVISDDQSSFRRVDEARVIDHIGGIPIIDLISAVLVPNELFDEADVLFRGRVKISHQN